MRLLSSSRLACVSTALALFVWTSPASAQGRPMTLDDVMELRNVGGVSISPDGSRVLFTVGGWEHPAAKDTSKGDRHEQRAHVWMVSSTGGDARQLTFGERGENGPQWSPDGRLIAFVSARGVANGDDGPRPQIWVLPADGGEAWSLTSARDGVAGFAWSPDGSQIAYLTTDSLSREAEARVKRRDDPKPFEGDMRMSHAWVIDVRQKATATKLTNGSFTVRSAPIWSADGNSITVLTSPTTLIRDERRDLWLVNVASKNAEKIAFPAGTTPQTNAAWSPDGKTLALGVITETFKPNRDGMYPRSLKNTTLALYDVGAKTLRDANSASFDNSVGQPRWSNDGKQILFVAQERVWSSVFSYDVASGRYVALTKQMMVRQPSYSRDGSRVAFAADSPNAPADVYVSDASFSSPKKVSNANPVVASLSLGETEVVTWKSTDGWSVEGILLKPVGYRAGQKVPLLVDVHGGPTGAHANGFKANWGNAGQYWAGQGWAVLYPNPRGSTGYGEKFMRGNIKDWGGGDYRDIMSGVDDLVRRGIADSTRLAITGWSYGGFMTGWVVSQTGRFKAAMMGAGLSDMLSMYGTTDIPGYIGTFYDGMPQLDGTLTNKSIEFYRSRSAITYADKVTTPLLMLHGGSDERVPIGQPMEYLRNLKDRGKTAELVFYPREGHGFSEYYHQLDKMKREHDWIVKYTLQDKVLQ